MASTKTTAKKSTGTKAKVPATQPRPAKVASASKTKKLRKELDQQFSLLVIIALGLVGIVGILLWNAVAHLN